MDLSRGKILPHCMSSSTLQLEGSQFVVEIFAAVVPKTWTTFLWFLCQL